MALGLDGGSAPRGGLGVVALAADLALGLALGVCRLSLWAWESHLPQTS